MPDLGTHLISGYWLYRLFNKPKIIIMPLIIIGCIMPDLISRAMAIVINPVKYYWFIAMFHTPVSQVFQCLGLSFLFEKEIRFAAFFSFTTGIILHHILDSMQTGITKKGYFLLFPFSDWDKGFAFFSSDSWPYALLLSIFILVITIIIKSKTSGK